MQNVPVIIGCYPPKVLIDRFCDEKTLGKTYASPVFSARGPFLALGGRTGGSSEASSTPAVSVSCDLVGAAPALSVAFLVIWHGNLPSHLYKRTRLDGRAVMHILQRRSVARPLLKHSSRKSSAAAGLNELFSSGTSRFLMGF